MINLMNSWSSFYSSLITFHSFKYFFNFLLLRKECEDSTQKFYTPFHRVRVVVVEIALAARETGHGSLEPRGSVRFRGGAVQNRVVVRRWTGMRHARSTTTRESVPKRTTLRVSARPRLARVPAIAHVHPAQSLGEDSDLCKRNRFVNDD